jgi:DME family drug/metabolite transporter
VLLVFAVISVLIPHSLYYNGVRHLTASRAIITATVEPILAIATAAVFVGETPGPARVAGAALVLGLQIRHEAEAVRAQEGGPAPSETPGHAP